MSGLHPAFASKLALIVAVDFALSVTATVAFVGTAGAKTVVNRPHASSQAAAQAPEPTKTGSISTSDHCGAGGYNWMQRAFNVHRTENQMMMPLPCR